MNHPRAQWRSIFAGASLLVLGAALGVTADRLHHRRSDADRLAFLPEIPTDPVGQIDRVVHLRPDQRERVAAIIEARQADIDSAWLQARIQLHATLDSVISEIATVLDPEQAEAFRAHVAEIHSGGADADGAALVPHGI